MLKLAPDDRQAIFEAAATAVVCETVNRTYDVDALSSSMKGLSQFPVYGVFTTLKKKSLLRGCCGVLEGTQYLGQALLHAAKRTAHDDPRMPAISPSELLELRLTVSILEQPEAIREQDADRMEAFEIGTHGLQIRRGNNSGLLLPSVPIEQGWTKQQFLEGLCRKAGLDRNDWKRSDVELKRFSGTIIEGDIATSQAASLLNDPASLVRAGLLDRTQLMRLRSVFKSNVSALMRGATPTYVAPELSDGNVHGVCISIKDSADLKYLKHVMRWSLRPGIPLQNSLFELAKNCADLIQKSADALSGRTIDFDVTVFWDPSAHMHLTADERVQLGHSLPSISETTLAENPNAASRAYLAMLSVQRDYQRQPRIDFACTIANGNITENKIEKLLRVIAKKPGDLQIFSLASLSTAEELLATTFTVADDKWIERTSAVAGQFYPSSKDDRKAMFDAWSNASEASITSKSDRKDLIALLSPHAGIIYSGKVAAATWQNIKLPDEIVVLSPKHTQHGVNFAIAPVERWKIGSESTIEGDRDLVNCLSNAIPFLEVDSAAHRAEHGVELQLPLVEYFAPRSRVVGITVGDMSWHDINIVARSFANWLRERLIKTGKIPILIISSDMHHFGSDSETRSLDRIAVQAMISRSPKELIDVCTQQKITMCGLIPAAIVLQTLTELDQGIQVEQIAYATSADAAVALRELKAHSTHTFHSPLPLVAEFPPKVVGYAGLQIFGLLVDSLAMK